MEPCGDIKAPEGNPECCWTFTWVEPLLFVIAHTCTYRELLPRWNTVLQRVKYSSALLPYRLGCYIKYFIANKVLEHAWLWKLIKCLWNWKRKEGKDVYDNVCISAGVDSSLIDVTRRLPEVIHGCLWNMSEEWTSIWSENNWVCSLKQKMILAQHNTLKKWRNKNVTAK